MNQFRYHHLNSVKHCVRIEGSILINFSCSCGAQFEAKNDRAGKRFACPKCGGTVSVPTNAEAKAIDELQFIEVDKSQPVDVGQTIPEAGIETPRSASRNITKRIPAIIISVVVAGWGIAAVMFVVSKASTPRDENELIQQIKNLSRENAARWDKIVELNKTHREQLGMLEAAIEMQPRPTDQELKPIKQKLADAEKAADSERLVARITEAKCEAATWLLKKRVSPASIRIVFQIIDKSKSDSISQLSPPDDLTIEEANEVLALDRQLQDPLFPHTYILYYGDLKRVADKVVSAARLKDALGR